MDRSEIHRSLDEGLRVARANEEQEMLLGDEETADADGLMTGNVQLLEQPFTPNPHAGLPVYTTIHR